jgi:hypothetical protein
VIRKQPWQLRRIFRLAKAGTPKSASMKVISRIASRSWRLMRVGTAASATAIVVRIAQNN